MDTAVTFQLPRFEGPLELLLHLIAKNRVEITDIPVALILEQYLDYLSRMREMDLEIASDFIVMAAQLIFIKTQILLPRPSDAEDAPDPRAELAEALLLYKRFKLAAAGLLPLTLVGFDRIPKEPEPPQALPPEYHHRPEELLRALRLMRERTRRSIVPRAESFSGIIGAEPVSVEEKIASVLALLLRERSVRLSDLYQTAASRSELVALFLAVLELVNSRSADMPEDGQITVNSRGAEEI